VLARAVAAARRRSDFIFSPREKETTEATAASAMTGMSSQVARVLHSPPFLLPAASLVGGFGIFRRGFFPSLFEVSFWTSSGQGNPFHRPACPTYPATRPSLRSLKKVGRAPLLRGEEKGRD
jgi:hypothetical protein